MTSLANLAVAFGMALMAVSSATGVRAEDSPDFYKGKTISLYVGSTTGASTTSMRGSSPASWGGRELQTLVADIYRTPANVVAKTKAMLK